MPREPREKVIERERQVWALRQQGRTHESIALELGLDKSTVTKILLRISDRVLSTLAVDARVELVEQLARLDHIVDESSRAWERSAKPAKTASKRVTKDTSGKGGEGTGKEREEQETEVSERDGNPRYLEIAMEALDRKAKRLGIDVPRGQSEKPDSNVETMSTIELLKMVMPHLLKKDGE